MFSKPFHRSSFDPGKGKFNKAFIVESLKYVCLLRTNVLMASFACMTNVYKRSISNYSKVSLYIITEICLHVKRKKILFLSTQGKSQENQGKFRFALKIFRS